MRNDTSTTGTDDHLLSRTWRDHVAVMSLLLTRFKEDPGEPPAPGAVHLIACPTAVVINWWIAGPTPQEDGDDDEVTEERTIAVIGCHHGWTIAYERHMTMNDWCSVVGAPSRGEITSG